MYDLGIVSVKRDTASPRCGGILDGASSGIFYKPFEPILEHERCVWIMSTKGATGYKVNIQYLGQDALKQVIVGGFRDSEDNGTFIAL